MIITTRDNKLGPWSLAIADATHNHSPAPPGAHLIYRLLARRDKLKELIVFQPRTGAMLVVSKLLPLSRPPGAKNKKKDLL